MTDVAAKSAIPPPHGPARVAWFAQFRDNLRLAHLFGARRSSATPEAGRRPPSVPHTDPDKNKQPERKPTRTLPENDPAKNRDRKKRKRNTEEEVRAERVPKRYKNVDEGDEAETEDDPERAIEDEEEEEAEAEEVTARAKAKRRAVLADRARCQAILGSPAAQQRPEYARTLAFETDLPSDVACRLLNAAASGAAERPGLHQRMGASPSRGVGLPPLRDVSPTSHAAIAASIVSNYELARGLRPVGADRAPRGDTPKAARAPDGSPEAISEGVIAAYERARGLR